MRVFRAPLCFCLTLIILLWAETRYGAQASRCLEYNSTLCPACEVPGAHNTVTISMLALDEDHEFVTLAERVIAAAKQLGGFLFDDRAFLHITLQYLCCFTKSQYRVVKQVIEDTPFTDGTLANLSFASDGVFCSQGGYAPNVANIRAQLDADSAARMAHYVQLVEQGLRRAGLNVTRTRAHMVPFHVSLVAVDTDKFPVAEFLKSVNKQVTGWNQAHINIREYFMVHPLHVFTANSTAPRLTPIARLRR